MKPTHAPTGLEQWFDLLQDKLLPVPAKTIALLRRQLKNPAVSLQQLSPTISRDPVLAMHCVSLANQLNRNPDTDVSTIELAVSTLGLDRIIDLAGKLPAIKLNSASVPHKQYFHALADSYHAATQALRLCRYKDLSIINTTRTAALFYGIGYWALWRYAPTQMSQIKSRILEQQQDTALAESEVLGCTVQQISERLIEHWQLSRLAVEALQHETSPDSELLEQIHLQATKPELLDEEQQRDAKLLLNSPFYPVKLANWLALTAPLGWDHPKTLRIQQLIADQLLQPLDPVTAILHQNCVLASREHPMPGLLSPAALMLFLPSSQQLSYRFGDTLKSSMPASPRAASAAKIAPKAATASTNRDPAAPQSKASRPAEPQATAPPRSAGSEPTAPQSTEPQSTALQSTLQQLTALPTSLRDRDQVLDLLMQGVVDGLGLERVISYQVNGNMQMIPTGHRGCVNDDPLTQLTQLTLDLEIPTLFKRLTQQSLMFLINSDNWDQAMIALPQQFKKICHPHSFILCSLVVAKQPPLIIYADLRNPKGLITPAQVQQFKQLSSAASHCLTTPG